MTNDTLLPRVLVADGGMSGISGLLLLAGAAALAPAFGIPEAELRQIGFVLLPFAALVLLAWRLLPRTWPTWAIIVVNLLWVAASFATVAQSGDRLTGMGAAGIVVQAIAVGGFALLEFVGVRRIGRPLPA